MYDVIIIGKGPAGISAALYTVRAKLSTLIIAKDYGALERADQIENYYGFEEPVKASELLENSARGAKRLGAIMIDAEVVGIEKGESFSVHTPQGTFESKAVLIATGKPKKTANIPGLSDYEGRGVSYCAICDGFFYRGKKIGVVGDGDFAVREANELLHFTDNITVYTNGSTLETETPLAVDGRRIRSVGGDGKLQFIVMEDGEQIPLDGLFVAIGQAGSTDFARRLGIEMQNDDIKVNENFMTNIDGLFACGDCVGGLAQVSKSVGEGAVCAVAMIAYVRKT
jgi:thioredoxin reductase (NADPH)